MNYTEVEGDLITLAREGNFNVIAHGCNCFCTMGAGLAPQMAAAFGADKFPLEADKHRGSINKLGMINYKNFLVSTVGIVPADYDGIMTMELKTPLTVINAYTQYGTGGKMPLDYSALQLCMTKINHTFKGKHIGLPLIGCGLAGGDWGEVKHIIETTLVDMDVTVVKYKSKTEQDVSYAVT